MLTSLSQTFYIYDHLTLLCQLKYKAKANQAPPKLVPDSVSVCANHSCSMHPWVTLRWNSNFTSNSNQHSTPWKNTANCSMMNAGQRKQGNDCWRNSFNISSYIHKSSSSSHWPTEITNTAEDSKSNEGFNNIVDTLDKRYGIFLIIL